MEETPCRLCGGKERWVIARRDSLGLPIQSVLCAACGLIFLSPRPTEAWYGRYYDSLGGKQHEYHHGGGGKRLRPLGSGFDAARRHGQGIADRLGVYMRPGVTIDVGSSEGGVLAGLRDRIGIEPIGIEPVAEEVRYATEHGILTHRALIEGIGRAGIVIPPAANIVCVKSLNHFLDPAHFFRWAWEALLPDGRLVLEVKNFRHQVRRAGRIWAGIQLDHPYMYVPETLARFVERAGFRVLALDVDEGKSSAALRAQYESGLPTGHIRLAAVRSGETPFGVPFKPEPRKIRELYRSLRPLNLYFHYLAHYVNVRKNVLVRLGL